MRAFADAPYSQLGWDQRANPLEGTAATDMAWIGHIIGFGWPLWKSLQELYNVQEMMLMGSSKISGWPGNKNLPLVTLSQRFCLNVTSNHHEDMEFIPSSVANHLCVCITATKDHDWSSTTYPSEPFLSCAAASLLHKDGNLDTFLKALEDKILSGIINVVKSRELASQLLWLLAKDLYIHHIPLHSSAIPAMDGQDWNSELIDCQMVSVVDHFCFVFGGDFWDQAGGEAKETFKDAFVNFSHWVSMDENISVPKNDDDQLRLIACTAPMSGHYAIGITQAQCNAAIHQEKITWLCSAM
ncbi:hypothetical protein EDC04DRAFT_2998998 [Pisolithus marmoratus]|nr:hypothetical protein EDC04DRAFT_2998998 [Pisolithus marmoratus]